MIDELIKLSKIFKDGFTIELKDSKIQQYARTDKPYIVSYLTLIEVRKDKILYNNVQHIPSSCIIGGWLDKDNNTYYIELNKVFKLKSKALLYAKKYNQKAIYNLKTEEVINV